MAGNLTIMPSCYLLGHIRCIHGASPRDRPAGSELQSNRRSLTRTSPIRPDNRRRHVDSLPAAAATLSSTKSTSSSTAVTSGPSPHDDVFGHLPVYGLRTANSQAQIFAARFGADRSTDTGIACRPRYEKSYARISSRTK